MKRKNDLSLTFRISGLAMISEAAKGSTVYPFVKPVVKEFSQAQWTRLLSEMGYEDVWIFEVAKPSITPGVKFVQAQKLLEEAQYDLPNGSPGERRREVRPKPRPTPTVVLKRRLGEGR